MFILLLLPLFFLPFRLLSPPLLLFPVHLHGLLYSFLFFFFFPKSKSVTSPKRFC